MFFCQHVKAVAHVMELLSFVQDRIRMHGVRGFLESLREKERHDLSYSLVGEKQSGGEMNRLPFYSMTTGLTRL